MKRFFALLFLLPASVLFGGNTNIQRTAAAGAAAPNRPAVFNWLVQSGNGADVRYGQFPCGSYWVAPAAGDAGVRLVSLTGSGNPGQTDLLTMDDNPRLHALGLTNGGSGSGSGYGFEEPANNEIQYLPKVYLPPYGEYISLVACMQRNEEEAGASGTASTRGQQVDAYDIVTVLPEPPAAGALRPPYYGGSLSQIRTWDDLDLTRLPSSALIPVQGDTTGAGDNLSHYLAVFSLRPTDGAGWKSYDGEWYRGMRPKAILHDYAAATARDLGDLMLRLCSTDTLAHKKPLLAAMVSLGLDNYTHVYGRAGYPGSWSSGAGQWLGQFGPAVFAASLLVDDTAAGVLRAEAVNPWRTGGTYGPQELKQLKRGATGVVLWGDGHIDPYALQSTPWPITSVSKLPDPYRRYWTDLKGAKYYSGISSSSHPTGQKNAGDPYGYIDGPAEVPGSSYMRTSNGPLTVFSMVMVLFPEFRATVNQDAIIEYVDRVARHGVWVAYDPVSTVALADQEGCNTWYPLGQGCEEYVTGSWGSALADIRYGIEGPVPRFSESRHGNSVTRDYISTFANGLYATVMAQYDGERYEDWFNPLNQVARPVVTVAPVAGVETAYMYSGTFDAEIYYTLDGSAPTIGSPEYTGPVAVGAAETLRAIAIKSGLTASGITTRSLDGTVPEAPSDAAVGGVRRGSRAGRMAGGLGL